MVAEPIYRQLASALVPMFYERPDAHAGVMRHAIGLNGSFFTGQRMLLEYAAAAYHMHVRVTAPVVPPGDLQA